MFAIMASLRTKPEHRDALIKLLVDDAREDFPLEQGWIRFDILRDEKDPNLIHVYEVFKDRKAHAAHVGTLGFKRWAEASKQYSFELVSKYDCHSIFPEAQGWVKAKH